MAENKLIKTLKKLGAERTELVTDPYDQQAMYEEIAAASEFLKPEDIAGLAGVESEFGKYDKPMVGGRARGTFQMMPNTIKYLSERSELPREVKLLDFL